MTETTNFAHIPVLCDEVVKNLVIKPAGIYVDATFGRGGHSRKILEHLDEQGRLVVIDKDPAAIKEAVALRDERVIVKHGTFALLLSWIKDLDLVGKVDGILLDLGVSSPQLDDSLRGFSFLKDGPLDMRMDLTQKLTAAAWLNAAAEKEIARVLFEYGEERFSRRIAKAIVVERSIEPIETTGRLAEIVSRTRW